MQRIIRIAVSLLLAVTATVPLVSARAASLSDLIIVVDNSGSMSSEVSAFQNGFYDFVNSIIASDVDLHVVLISADSALTNGICVPAPFGSGSCPGDSNLPGYRHIAHSVGSNSALSDILNTYGQWQGSLRPGASKEFLVLTDDDSSISAATFTTNLLALDPGFQGYHFNGIVAGNYGFSSPCAFIAGSPGSEYLALINQTGGVFDDLCNQDIDTGGMQVIAQSVTANANPVPLPPALWLFGTGLVALAQFRRRAA